jgi:hypothetical protein
MEARESTKKIQNFNKELETVSQLIESLNIKIGNSIIKLDKN